MKPKANGRTDPILDAAQMLVRDRARRVQLDLTDTAVQMLSLPLTEDVNLASRIQRLESRDPDSLVSAAGKQAVESLDLILDDMRNNLHPEDENIASSLSVVSSLARTFCRVPPFCRRGL